MQPLPPQCWSLLEKPGGCITFPILSKTRTAMSIGTVIVGIATVIIRIRTTIIIMLSIISMNNGLLCCSLHFCVVHIISMVSNLTKTSTAMSIGTIIVVIITAIIRIITIRIFLTVTVGIDLRPPQYRFPPPSSSP